LQYVAWPDAFPTAFDYTVNPSLNVADVSESVNDSAVNYFFGADSNNPLNLGPGSSDTVSASLFATLPPPPDAENPFCSVLTSPPSFQVQDTGSGIAEIADVTTNATLNIPAFIIGATDLLTIDVNHLDLTQHASVDLTIFDLADNSIGCSLFLEGTGTPPVRPTSRVAVGGEVEFFAPQTAPPSSRTSRPADYLWAWAILLAGIATLSAFAGYRLRVRGRARADS
jgi:hypothetical protein